MLSPITRALLPAYLRAIAWALIAAGQCFLAGFRLAAADYAWAAGFAAFGILALLFFADGIARTVRLRIVAAMLTAGWGQPLEPDRDDPDDP